jgi:hypothetical protein
LINQSDIIAYHPHGSDRTVVGHGDGTPP